VVGALVGCGWTAAWLTAREREMLAPREILPDDGWRGELEWQDSRGWHKSGHRPDFVASLPSGARLPIEVELRRVRLAISLRAVESKEQRCRWTREQR
jgi:hypothetical protein